MFSSQCNFGREKKYIFEVNWGKPLQHFTNIKDAFVKGEKLGDLHQGNLA